MQATICPPKSTIADYLAGKLEYEDSGVIETHLEQCSDCDQAAAEIEGHSDSIVGTLKLKSAASEFDVENELTASECRVMATPEYIGAYELTKPLGAGAMGTVYLARHRKLQKDFALKLLPLPVAAKTEFVSRFQREITTTARLDHPAIVRATDAGEENGIHYLAMDAIDGADLASVLRTCGKLNHSDAAEVGRQAALGLAHAHSQGVVHRDIKPSNLMLDTQGQVRILDFGLAQLGFWQSDCAEITTVGQLMGTLDYMAPEQAERGGAVDYRADLYSLGATLFKLLTGQAPLSPTPDLTPIEKLRLLSTHCAPKVRTLRDDVPEELARLVDCLLSKDPAARPASAAHLAELLAPFCEGHDLQPIARKSAEFKSNQVTPRIRWANGPIDSAAEALPRSEANETIQGTNEVRRRSNKGWAIAAVFSTAALLISGILFVIETSKGQLVIESSDANVDIRIVDDAGEEAKELRIVPGTQTTKLRGGKYVIEIDSPSDSFSVSNEQFTIRNGETIVAKISPRVRPSDPVVEADAPEGLYDESDKRLDELVFKGDTLDTWLRNLRFERDMDRVTDSLRAVTALASKELEPLVRPVLMEFLARKGMVESPHLRGAVGALSRVTEEGFLDAVTELLQGLDDPEAMASLLYATNLDNLPKIRIDGEALDKLSHWVSLQLNEKKRSPALIDAIKYSCRKWLSDGANLGLVPEARQGLVAFLRSHPTSFTDEGFWLFNKNDKEPWCDEFRDEIIERAIKVLESRQAEPRQQIHAAVVVDSCINRDFNLTGERRERLAKVIKDALTTTAQDPQSALELHEVQSWMKHQVASRKIKRRDSYISNSSQRTPKANRLASLLNVAVVSGLEKELSAELEHLHDVLSDLALHGSTLPPGFASNASTRFITLGQEVPYPSPDYYLAMRQILFLQTGTMLGLKTNVLESRFKELRVADRKRRAENLLNDLEHGSERERSKTLQLCEHLIGMHDSPRSVEVFRNVLTELSMNSHKEWEAQHSVRILSRVSGDNFLGQVTICLEKTNEPEILLAMLGNLWEENEFRLGGSNASQQKAAEESLRSFFAWLDKQELGVKTKAWMLLKGLMRDRQQLVRLVVVSEWDKEKLMPGLVSTGCQEMIRDYLRKQPELGADFWLREINSPPFPNQLPFGEVFEREQLKQALAVTQDFEAELESRVQALMCINVLSSKPFFTEANKAQVFDAIRRELALFENEAGIEKQLRLFPYHFSYVFFDSPAVPELAINTSPYANDPDRHQVWGCMPIACLNLIDRLNARQVFVDEVRHVYQAVSKLNLRKSYFPSKTSRNWPAQVERAKRYDDIRGMLGHALLIQSGRLLGEDTEDLLGKPDRLMEEERERKRRFIQPGDTLAIYIPGLLPMGAVDPPVMQAGTRDPVVGFPVPVSESGNISVPFLGSIKVRGMELADVQAEIVKINKEKTVMKSDTSISVFFLMRASEKLELRNISGQSSPAK